MSHLIVPSARDLAARSKEAAVHSAFYFLVGSLGTLAAIAALPSAFPAAGPEAGGDWGFLLRIVAPEAFGLYGFARFGWWCSHWRALEASHGASKAG